ncbi:MAG: DUF2892 domain-containing protein [Chitinophagales bacterium]|nr:DUF2892 domain-containing protein [Chitinophagales bacterium]MDW8419218.1 DUF2892 domain-containing protein [Chitinophagales bacterium]
MKPNMGTIDRAIRVLVALIIGFLYYNGTIQGTVGLILLVLAGVFVLTSAIGFCPLYLPLRINTRKNAQ